MKKIMKKIRLTKKNALLFLQERKEMLDAGFPYCYKEKGIPMHCNSCIEFWKKRKETHKKR